MSSTPSLNAYHNAEVIQAVLGLLREVPGTGHTPATLVELLRERGLLKEDLAESTLYQRVYRALRQLSEMGLAEKSGTRYLVVPEAIREELRKEAIFAIQRAFATPFITRDASELHAALTEALKETLKGDPTGQAGGTAEGSDLTTLLDD